MLQVIVPDAPTAGVVHEKAGPLVCVAETNVVDGGSVSVSVAFAASDGPLFVSVTEYVMFVPVVPEAGPLFVTARSAMLPTVAVVVEELFAGVGSLVVAVTVAVFAMLLPLAADAATCITNEKAAEVPAVSVASVHEIVPPDPAAGVVQVKVGPLLCVAETNVVDGGSVSVSVTTVASEGPLFVTVTV